MYPYYNYPSTRYQPPQTDIQFVNGKSSAESFMMPPNSRMILMDSELPRFYLKEVDATGMYKISIYEFQEVKEPEPVSSEYITRQEFEEWKAMLNESNLAKKQQSTATITATEFQFFRPVHDT